MRAPIQTRLKPWLRYAPLWVATVAFLGVALPVVAQGITAISQSYTASGVIPVGSIISLKANASDQVVAATTSNVDNLLGVVINATGASLSVSSAQSNQVQVTTTGITSVFVSDINGSIVEGDHITASPVSGVGMKATGNVRIVGVAQGDVTGGTKETYKDKAGHEQSTVIGRVPVLVNVAYYFKEPDKTLVPTAIQSLADALAGKKVNTLPIIIGAGIFIIMLILVVSIVYSMIKSSIISVGRNPMSQSAIYRDLIQLSMLVVAILAVGLIAIYLVLTRL